MAVAAIKFTQGMNTDLAGRALVGVAGVLVAITNGDNTGVNSFRIEILDVPLGSAIPVGILVDQIGVTPSASFTPDVSGTYQIKLRLNGDDSIIDVRDFIVPNSRNWYVPALRSNDSTFNYSGQLLGWKSAMSFIYADIVVQIGGSASTGPGVQTIPDLRAVASASRSDKQVRLVEDAGAQYRFDNDTGANIVDDGNFNIKPNDVLLTSNGRWYKLPDTSIAEFVDRVITPGYVAGPNAPLPTNPIGLSAFRGDIGGVQRIRAGFVWDEANQEWRSSLLASDDITFGSDVGLRASGARFTTLNTNRLAFVGASNQLQTPASVVIATQTFNFQSTVQMDALKIASGALTWDLTGITDNAGAGSPEGVVTAVQGSVFRSLAGDMYVKKTGVGNTGWAALFAGVLSGDVTGAINATRVEQLRGDSVNNFVAVPATTVMRFGATTGGAVFPSNGTIRSSNAQTFSITTRDTFSSAGTADMLLFSYIPFTGGLTIGGGTVAPITTSIRGTTLSADYTASFRIKRNGVDAILFTSSNIEIQRAETANVTHQSQNADVAPTNFELVTQAPFAGATTNAKATPGKFIVRIPSGFDLGQGENRNGLEVNISGVASSFLDFDGILFKEQGARLQVRTSTSGTGQNLALRGGSSLQSGNNIGGHLTLQGGARFGTGTSGNIRFLSGTTGNVLGEVFEDNASRQVFSLLRGTAFSGTDAPTGDKILHIGNATTEPTSVPANGHTRWGDSTGKAWEEFPDGNIHRGDAGGLSSIVIAGADVTLTRAQFKNSIIRITTADANRAITFPNQEGRVWFVKNETTRTTTLQTAGQVGAPSVGNAASVIISVDAVGAVFIVKRD